jgi:peptidoglycan hydrolase-like protein with peptidoglycan-binding domain
MTYYRLGSSGPEVEHIQHALKAIAIYAGPVDGTFGGGTEASVRKFQQRSGLESDGVVGKQTWNALLPNEPHPAATLADKSLDYRCVALTGTFETGTGFPECFCGISGDFDKQGISFGVLQWNFGQGSLQPLLQEMIEEHGEITQSIFGTNFAPLREAVQLGQQRDEQQELLAFSRSIQHPVTHRIYEPWLGYAKALGRTKEFQNIQVRHAGKAFERARALVSEFSLLSERSVALMFDIVTQNGSIGAVTRAQIRSDIEHLSPGLSDDDREVAMLRIVANRRAEAANPIWVDDVRRRKLCVANGKGIVHGIPFDLEADFGISLAPHSA